MTTRRNRPLALALAGMGLAGVVVLAAGADRLPSWNWSFGGVAAEVGPGRGPVEVAETPPTPVPQARGAGRGSRGTQGSQGSPGGQGSDAPGSRVVFSTYAEAEAFAGKTQAHLLAPQWVPDGFGAEPLTVMLSALTPEQAAILGRVQRVASTQRFTALGGQFTIVQSVPPPPFDFLMLSGGGDETITLDNGLRAQFGNYPQGVIVYWHERGDARSVSVIGDQGAAALLSRADWLHIANSLT